VDYGIIRYVIQRLLLAALFICQWAHGKKVSKIMERSLRRSNKSKIHNVDTNAAHLQQLQYAGALIRQVFLNIHKAYHGILVKNGMCQKVLDAWSAKVDDGEISIVSVGTLASVN
jgi:hypothetical protein